MYDVKLEWNNKPLMHQFDLDKPYKLLHEAIEDSARTLALLFGYPNGIECQYHPDRVVFILNGVSLIEVRHQWNNTTFYITVIGLEEMKKFISPASHKIRTAPKSVREMYKWGMIPHHAYLKVRHLPLETAIAYIENEGLWQTCNIHIDQLIEYCVQWRDYPIDYDNKAVWVTHCLKLCGGNVDFQTCIDLWDNKENITCMKIDG